MPPGMSLSKFKEPIAESIGSTLLYFQKGESRGRSFSLESTSFRNSLHIIFVATNQGNPLEYLGTIMVDLLIMRATPCKVELGVEK